MPSPDDADVSPLADQDSGFSAEAGGECTPGDVEIDDALFERLLENDLANIVRKAKAGKTLSHRERTLIEDERARRAKGVDQAEFHLESEGGESPLARMTQAELAVAWGYSVRQVKNWIADGRKAGDPAPVAKPPDMPAWFRRIYAPRECPEKLRLASLRLVDGQKPMIEVAAAAPAPARIEIADEEKGLLAMLDRYRTAEAELHRKYMAAIDAGDETRAQFLLSEWGKMGDKLRALEKAAPKALEELGIFVRRAEIQRELEPLHSAIMKAFRQEFRLARPRLKATMTQEEWARLVDETVEKVAMMLVETEFREPLELQVA